MPIQQPTAELMPVNSEDLELRSWSTTPISWEEAVSRLDQCETYWLATARPDGPPHVRPVLAVCVDGAVHFCTSPRSSKGRDLSRTPGCVMTASCPGMDIVAEGEARRLVDESQLRRVADAYASKYGWRVEVRDGTFQDTFGAPTAGPPPYEVYELIPSKVFGFSTDPAIAPTRWRFE
jgi:nitroimidazol reductase NimA-like FMN-containing flavoprotein (pyridoxamine 5'-phosphate oxidase superfamily)